MGLVVAFCSAGVAACGGGERQDEEEPEGEFPVEIVSAEFPAKQRLAQTTELRLTVANAGEETIPDLAVTVNTQAETTTEGDAATTEDTDPEDSGTSGSAEDVPEEQLGEEVDKALEEELEEATGVAPDDEESAGSETTGTEETTGTGAEDTGTGAEDASESAGESGTEAGGSAQARGAFSVLSAQPDLAIPSRPVWILEQGYPRAADEAAGPAPEGELSGSGGAETAQTNTFSFGELDPNSTTELVWLVTAVQPGTYTVRYRIAAGLQGKAVAVNEDGSEPEGEFVVRITDVPPQTRVDDSGKVVPIKKGDIIGQAGTKEQKGELGE